LNFKQDTIIAAGRRQFRRGSQVKTFEGVVLIERVTGLNTSGSSEPKNESFAS
jgi:hypothetical protein